MIKLETVHIEEMRGIRKLNIDFRRERFAICGPNGSGKSGVIDAVEFGLTGQIGRLTGRGTKGLSVSEHGPHVDKAKFPDAAFVKLGVFLPQLKKSATITRKVSRPKTAKIEPADPDIVAALTEIADHPEITLSRRDILRFILVEPTRRSEEIQALLKLDELGSTRSVFNAASNRLQNAAKDAEAQVVASRNSLLQHLQLATLPAKDVLEAVNKRRIVLGLPEIGELTADTTIDAGLSKASQSGGFNKVSALRDLKAFDELAAEMPTLAKADAAAIVADLEKLETDPSLLFAFQRRSFIERGLSLVDGPGCPLCDTQWTDEQHLRDHLKAKLDKSTEARKLQDSLVLRGSTISQTIVRIQGVMAIMEKLASSLDSSELATLLSAWNKDLSDLRAKIASVDQLAGLKERFSSHWPGVPEPLHGRVEQLRAHIQAKPDQTATIDAQTFLTTAQLRLSDYREAMRKSKAAQIAAAGAKRVYDTYCAVMENALNTLYEEVEADFSKFYRAINEDDEGKFTAKLTPSAGKLNFEVNFYERGLYPPGAYHSEGHQDSMGVCLYLALMKRLFGEGFTFALLDDVVMSVDVGHRYQFCKVLKTFFPETQFIITTHDRLWAEQMKSAGLVSSKTSIAFHGWSIDAGPLVESNKVIWEEIAAALDKGKVETAALALRHHLEYVSRHLADLLGASPQFRADSNYDLGELLPSVLSRLKELYGKAAKAAQSWGNDAAKEHVAKLKSDLSASTAAQDVERWAVNKAVHYNEWANFGKKDFQPVVSAFKNLLDAYRCTSCESWLQVIPRINPQSLRCDCGAVNINLNAKGK